MSAEFFSQGSLSTYSSFPPRDSFRGYLHTYFGSRLIFPFYYLLQASFLLTFGYIDEDDSDNNRGAYDPNSPEFQASIRRLQRFGNIPVTGRMDAATISLINTDRCGVKDPQNNAAVGRFSLQGTTWKKRVRLLTNAVE